MDHVSGLIAREIGRFSVSNVPLPVAGEIDALVALHCQGRYAAHLIAIRDAAVIFRHDDLPNESADSIKAKLKRGTFAATFFLACLAAMELEGVALEEI